MSTIVEIKFILFRDISIFQKIKESIHVILTPRRLKYGGTVEVAGELRL